jgi:intein/homing endonuclease
MVHPRITGYNKQIYKVTLDNGESVRVTENHKFKMKDKRYKKVCDLQPGDSLNLLHRYIPDGRSESRADQYQTFSYDGVTYTEHTMVYEHRHGKIPKGYHVNHLDHNKLNNNIGNLECLSEHDHLSKHSKMENYKSPEGKIPYRGKLEDTVRDYLGGLRSMCAYINANNIKYIPKFTTFLMAP